MSGRLDEIDRTLANFGVGDEAIALRRHVARASDVDLASIDAALAALGVAGDGVVLEFSGEATGEHEVGDLFEDIDQAGDANDDVGDDAMVTIVDE